MKAKKGPKDWVPLDIDPALMRLLNQYRAVLNGKLQKRKMPKVGLGRVVGAILSHFLLPQKDRIQDEFEALLAWTARDLVRDHLDDSTIATAGLSEVSYRRRPSQPRRIIPGSVTDRHRAGTTKRNVRPATTGEAGATTAGSPKRPGEVPSQD